MMRPGWMTAMAVAIAVAESINHLFRMSFLLGIVAGLIAGFVYRSYTMQVPIEIGSGFLGLAAIAVKLNDPDIGIETTDKTFAVAVVVIIGIWLIVVSRAGLGGVLESAGDGVASVLLLFVLADLAVILLAPGDIPLGALVNADLLLPAAIGLGLIGLVGSVFWTVNPRIFVGVVGTALLIAQVLLFLDAFAATQWNAYQREAAETVVPAGAFIFGYMGRRG
jgi:hypothetical protein